MPVPARIAQIDIRPEQLGKRAPITLGLLGDVAATLDALLPLLTEKSDRGHLDKAVAHHGKARKGLDDLAAATSRKGLIHPQQVAAGGRERRGIGNVAPAFRYELALKNGLGATPPRGRRR